MSTISAANISDGTDTVGTGYVVNGSAKAWWFINSSAELQNSINVSSGTDYSSAEKRANLTSAMASSKSPIFLTSLRNAEPDISGGAGDSMVTTSQVRISTRQYDDTMPDVETAGGIFGDLA